MKISVVIPCYNEAESIGEVVRGIPKEVFEVIVVDNNSTDKSAEIAATAGARVVSAKTQGYGAALKAGFRAAQGDIVATLDGDRQYPAEKIPELAGFISRGEGDFVSGCRFPLSDKSSLPFQRIFGNMLLTLATNLLFGYDIKDSQSGMWVFKREIAESVPLESDDMPLSEEVKVRVIADGRYRFREVHIPYRLRLGDSKLSPIKHGIKNLLFLIKLRLSILISRPRRSGN